MAKKNKVEIDVIVDDKGTNKKVALESKKAAKGLDDTAKSAHTADRNLKGAAQASANGTKNFSKMSQGMGGLVGAYATIAATVFATTAAFQALKTAADFRVVKESQIAFSAATGQGMRSLTREIQTASDNMLNFQAASEAAAIGIASGLSGTQLNELSEGAANVSKILGRDVTDSFNRLVRGVTKAEPELLDELGITLRLADAQENYATKLNKSAKDLSNFEKKQAVFVEVQTQLEEKYNAVADATEMSANAISQLAVAFDKVLNPVKDFFALIAEPVAEFFSKNIRSLSIVMGLLAVPLLKSVIPGLEGFGESAKQSAEDATKAFKQTKGEIDELAKSRKNITADPVKAGKSALAGVDAPTGSGAALLKAGKKPNQRQLASMRRFAREGKGIVKQMSASQRRDYLAAIESMIQGKTKLGIKVKNIGKQIQTSWKITTKRIEMVWQKTMAKMSTAATKMANGVNKVMKMAGFIGIIMMIFDLLKMAASALGLMKPDERVQAYAAEVEGLTQALKEHNKEFKEFAKTQEALTEKGFNPTKNSMAAFGGLVDSYMPKITKMMDLLNNPVTFKREMEDIVKLGGKEVISMKERTKRFQELTKAQKMSVAEARKQLDSTTIVEGSGDYNREKRKAGKNAPGLLDKLVTDKADVNAATEQMGQSLKVLKGGLEATKMASTEAGGRFLTLLNMLIDGEKLTPALTKEFKELGKQFSETGQKATFVKMQLKEVTKQYTSQVNGIKFLKTSQTDLLKLLKDTRATIMSMDAYQGRWAEVQLLNEQIDKIERLQTIEIGFLNEKLRLQGIIAGAKIGATPMEAKELERQKKLLEVEIKRNNIIAKLNEANGSLDPAMQANYQHQLMMLNFQEESLERQIDRAAVLGDTLKSAFETNMASGIEELITGAESSFTDFLGKMGENVLKEGARELSKMMTQDIMGGLFGKKSSPEEKMKTAMKEGGEIAAQQIKDALSGKLTSTGESTVSDAVENMTGDGDGALSTFSKDIKETLGGEAPFLTKLKDTFKNGGDFFSNAFGEVFSGLGEIGGGLLSIFGFASGGIASPGKKMPGYSTGGIARGSKQGYPAVLHGTEAVVPLPNGKSIPVEMSGGGSTQNNVVVNVSSGGEVSTESSNTPDAEALGKAVAAAVKEELQNQKRSGGILNPYGVA